MANNLDKYASFVTSTFELNLKASAIAVLYPLIVPGVLFFSTNRKVRKSAISGKEALGGF